MLLAHSGTIPGTTFQEDSDIARGVDGIDVILSGHAHTIIPELIHVNNTVIAGVGTELMALGKLQLNKTDVGWDYAYDVIYLTDQFEEDPTIKAQIDPYVQQIENGYFKTYGIEQGLNGVFAYSPYDYFSGDSMVKSVENYPFAALLTDSYLYALNQSGVSDVDLAIVPVGIVRAGLYQGDISVINTYNVLSYGISPLDGSSGAPIVTFYLNGRELYDICETSISLSSMVTTVQMFFSGLRYTYSMGRPILDRVYKVEVLNKESGAYELVERNDKKLYKVAISYTSAQNIALIKNNTYELMNIEPKNADGSLFNPEKEMSDHVVTCSVNGKTVELKEWFALYEFLSSMPKNKEGLPQISEKYSQPAAFMIEEPNSFVIFFKNPSKAAWLMLAALIVIIALLIGVLFGIRTLFRAASRHRKAD